MEFIIMIVVLVGILSFVQWRLEQDEGWLQPIKIDGKVLKPKRKTVKRKATKKVASKKKKVVKKKVVKKRSKKK